MRAELVRAELTRDIEHKVAERARRTYLREQLEVIQSELGVSDPIEDEAAQLEQRVLASALSEALSGIPVFADNDATAGDSGMGGAVYAINTGGSSGPLTRFVDWTDRATCVLFGDGAGAAVLQPGEGEPGETGLIAFLLESYGEHGGLLRLPAGGSRQPLTPELLAERENCIRMEGPELFKLAVRGVPEIAEKVVAKAGLTLADINCVIMHQANLRIIEAAAKRLDIPDERLVVNVDRYGNTSAASMAIALDEACQTGKLKSGDYLLLVGFGAGFTLGAAVIRWA